MALDKVGVMEIMGKRLTIEDRLIHLMGDEVSMTMARELAEKPRCNLSIDWQYKENV
jgi:hypothetical protein